MRTPLRWLAVGAFFAVLTVLATWPQFLCLTDRVKDEGDPLFNAWVLAWNAHKLGRAEIADYFDANIFYPHQRTLAYSEHLFPQSLLAAPLIWASGNPVLAHNVIFLLSFFTSALGMFALARRLTGATLPSLLAGVIFAFCPFMFDHLSHVQVLAAGGIPLSFLLLDRFLAEQRWRDAVLFAVCFTAQILANGYYALFLSLGVGVVLLVELPRRRLLCNPKVWRGLLLAGVLVAATAGPFFRQYFLMQREIRFRREVSSHATLTSYLAAPKVNRLWGPLTARWRTAEGQLFPGVTAALLALLGAVTLVRRGARAGIAETALLAGVGVALVSAAWVAWRGPVALPPLLSVSSSVPPAIVAAVLLIGAVLVYTYRLSGTTDAGVGVYVALGLLAFTLTFGERGPYQFFHLWVPGFDGIRAVTRVHVLTMVALALLGALGARQVLAWVGRRRAAAFSAVLAVVALEYASVPLPLTHVAIDEEERRLYRWVDRNLGEREPILELPLPADQHEWWRIEPKRMLASAMHWRPMVNGYSGLAPPLYDELQRRWREQPLVDNVDDARTLGVRYLLVHLRRKDQSWGAGAALAHDLHALPQVRLVQLLPQAWVFEVEGIHSARALTGTRPTIVAPVQHIAASARPEDAPLAFDGNLATRWSTGRPQRPHDQITIQLEPTALVAGLHLHLASSRRDFPRGWVVSVSSDGAAWREVAHGSRHSVPITALLNPADPVLAITFPAAPASFIRITCTKGDPVYYWSIHELRLLLGE